MVVYSHRIVIIRFFARKDFTCKPYEHVKRLLQLSMLESPSPDSSLVTLLASLTAYQFSVELLLSDLAHLTPVLNPEDSLLCSHLFVP